MNWFKKIFYSENRFFKATNKHNEVTTYMSPLFKYKLEIEKFSTKPGCWDYSLGKIYSLKTNHSESIAEIKRNYSHFPFAWAIYHPNGHDYLICGKSYMGQTVVELDTGKVFNYSPKGEDFCCVEFYPSPDKTKIAISGCYWGGTYEVRICDFSDPSKLPLKVFQHVSDDAYDKTKVYYSDFSEWIDDQTFKIKKTYDWCIPLNKSENDVTIEEIENLKDDDWEERKEEYIVKLN